MTKQDELYKLTTELLEAAESVLFYPNLKGPIRRLDKARLALRGYRRQHCPNKPQYLLKQSGKQLSTYWIEP